MISCSNQSLFTFQSSPFLGTYSSLCHSFPHLAHVEIVNIIHRASLLYTSFLALVVKHIKFLPSEIKGTEGEGLAVR